MKNPIDNARFVTFFHNILPQGHTYFVFLPGFQWEMLGDLLDINNFNWNPVNLKKNLLEQ